MFAIDSVLADKFFTVHLLEFADVEFLARQFVFKCVHSDIE